MKRFWSLTLVLTLVLALALPAAAFAKRGGTPANGKDKGGRPSFLQSVEENEDEAPAQKGKGKKKDKAADTLGEELEGEGLEADEETSEKATGIENALSRLQRNLERQQVRFEAGLRKALPLGLQNTIAKFMSWLGIGHPADDADNGEGSGETTPTIEPEVLDEDPEGGLEGEETGL